MKSLLFIGILMVVLFMACSSTVEQAFDIESVIEFVDTTTTNRMTDQLGEKLVVLENYEVIYFDFTGEGNEDVAIITWAEDNTYLPVIFVTEDMPGYDYFLINSDFRGNQGDLLFYENGFIVKDDQLHQSYDLAYNFDNEEIKSCLRYVNYGDVVQVLQSEIDTQYIMSYTLEKVDGFKQFSVNIVSTYIDESGESHVYENLTQLYTFNQQACGYDIEETFNTETLSLELLVSEFFITGTNDSLSTFEKVYNEDNLEVAINFYYENRQQFSKVTRIQYLNDVFSTIDEIFETLRYSGIYGMDEVIIDNVIVSVSVNINPIPEQMNSVFSVVKEFYIDDGGNVTSEFENDGYYSLACINPEITNKLNLMGYDRMILQDEAGNYGNSLDGYVDVIFENQSQMLEDIQTITYPTVLIDNLLQLNEFRHKNIWKTKIVIIPEQINYESQVDF